MGRYFITGGGTGGHIYPAIAVANALLDDEIFYIGNPKNLEYDVVKKSGYTFLPVSVSAMPRKISSHPQNQKIGLQISLNPPPH